MFKALHSIKYRHHKYCPVTVSQTTGIWIPM